MKNKYVGYGIIIIAIIIWLLMFTYNRTLLDLAQFSCSIEGPDCPHLQSSNQQLFINTILLLIMVALGIYMIFFSHEERIITKVKKVHEQIQHKKITKENYQKAMHNLEPDEKKVLEKVIEKEGSVFQSELVEETNLTKVKITRILDRLEGKGLIERKRRGMTNVVILK